MNILFLTNYYGLHGSSIDLLTYAKHLKKNNHKVFFVGGDGDIREAFKEIGDGIYVYHAPPHLPSIRRILLLKKLIKAWNVDIIIGVGKFLILESQTASLLFKNKHPVNIINFSPRHHHWEKHPCWHIPMVGSLAINCQYWRDRTISEYRWPEGRLYLLSARYDVPETIRKLPDIGNRKKVLFVRRLDFPKYKSVLSSLDQIGKWDIWHKWSVEIAGGGTHERLVLDEIERIKSRYPEANITFLGRRTDVAELMKAADIVIGSERVAVEAMAQGCITILADDDGLIDVITPENIEKYSYDNFIGFANEACDYREIKIKLFALLANETEINGVVAGNFDFIKKHLDIKVGIKILTEIVQKSYESSFARMEVPINALRILKAWAGVYIYLIKDRTLRSLWNQK